MNRYVTYHRSYFPYSLFSVITQIRFAQDDDRTRATLPGDDQVSFDTSWVEVFIQRGDKKNSIHVGRDDLLFDARACHLPSELTFSWQDGVDRYFAVFRGWPD